VFISISVKIWSSKLQQLVEGRASPRLSYRVGQPHLLKHLYPLQLLHIFYVNKAVAHSICSFLGYNTKRPAAIPLGPHIITGWFSCISYASRSINVRQWYQATTVPKKVRHDNRLLFLHSLGLFVGHRRLREILFVTFTSCSMLNNLNTPQPTHIPVTSYKPRLFTPVAFVTDLKPVQLNVTLRKKERL
jgi:hypothetical protein